MAYLLTEIKNGKRKGYHYRFYTLKKHNRL